jgi:membrane protease YdiL (CAAX protease family)
MRGKSILEAIAIFTLIRLITGFAPGIRDFINWEIRILRWSYFYGLLIIAIPIMLILYKGKDFNDYGWNISGWRQSLGLGMVAFFYTLIPYGILWMLILPMGLTYTGYAGGIFLSVGYIFAAFLVMRLSYIRDLSGHQAKTNRNLIIIAVMLLIPLVLGYVYHRFTLKLVSTIVWQLVVGGFGEEFLYRGYIQTGINEEFGHPWTLWDTKIGPGLIVSSVLYGLSRALEIFKPWRGIYDIAWGWGLFAFAAGIFYGLLRERTGNILTGTVAHGVFNAFGEAITYIFRIKI